MRILTLIAALTCGISACCGCAASAADLGGITATAEALAAGGRTPFAGAYVGVQLGGEFTSIDIDDAFDGISADGLTGGAHGGFRWVIAPGMRAGLWAEAGLSAVNTKLGTADALMQDWYGAGGADLCLVRSRAALCGRAGYQFAQWSSDFMTGTADVRSWLVGASAETMVAGNISAGLTADYLILHEASAEGEDFTDLIRRTEGLRVLGRLTLHQ